MIKEHSQMKIKYLKVKKNVVRNREDTFHMFVEKIKNISDIIMAST